MGRLYVWFRRYRYCTKRMEVDSNIFHLVPERSIKRSSRPEPLPEKCIRTIQLGPFGPRIPCYEPIFVSWKTNKSYVPRGQLASSYIKLGRRYRKIK